MPYSVLTCLVFAHFLPFFKNLCLSIFLHSFISALFCLFLFLLYVEFTWIFIRYRNFLCTFFKLCLLICGERICACPDKIRRPVNPFHRITGRRSVCCYMMFVSDRFKLQPLMFICITAQTPCRPPDPQPPDLWFRMRSIPADGRSPPPARYAWLPGSAAWKPG